ncbi:MAG: response regulator transcription factor [Rhodothermales bacterium]
MAPIRVIIADDHPTFRSGLRSFLEQDADFEVLGEAEDGQQALRMAYALHPDVMVLDLDMPGLSGLDVTKELRKRAPEIQILILSAYADEDYIFGVLDCGASGYLTKQESLSSIVEAVRGVGRGEAGWLSQRIAALFVGARRNTQRGVHLLAPLSDREREVLGELSHGLTNAQIGEKLFISESTVKKHVNNIYEKIGVSTRAQAVAWMWRNGLVDDGA